MIKTECYLNLMYKLEAIQHLERDLEGERNAVSDYQDHREFLEVLLGGAGKLDDSKIMAYIAKLSEIESEEKHHGEELTELLETEFFNTSKALEDFVSCECSTGREQAKVRPAVKTKCAWCNDKGHWLSDESLEKISHGLCKDCAAKMAPDVEKI